MAVITQYILVGNILTTKWYKSLSLPFSCFTSGSVSTRKWNPAVSFHWTRGFSYWL